MVTIQKIFTNLVFSETLKSISTTLQNFSLVQPRVDEIVGGPDDPPPPLGIKWGSEIAWYKKG